jgi:hypothetical protein
MERDELKGRIVKAIIYLENTDLTPFQREKAEMRLDELRAELRKIDQPPPKVEDPRIPEAIETIRSILYGGAKNGTNQRTDTNSGV